ncbi:hypothetical protein BEP19_13025 [Ammoniphilus oxalaticus]|uniref:Uncharacterized protein n=1 Tax=Ammoniphilus oxalaticus TaxID=66863 RepID=A0A419SHC5_9BACL|nr:hypothetical protein [Ammoniphilus oxalaticus]RKD23135.1 hypothetical protein BEP19_13025 [Ammoniphilus oxalaticus]
MKKWLWGLMITLVIVLGAGFAGYNFFMEKAAEKLSRELSSNENLMKDIEKFGVAAGSLSEDEQSKEQTGNEGSGEPDSDQVDADGGASGPDDQSAPNPASSTSDPNSEKSNASKTGNSGAGKNASGGGLQFKSKQEAVKFVMTRFSASEVSRLSKMSVSDLTPAEKQELKALAYSKFSPAEIEAVRKAVSQ